MDTEIVNVPTNILLHPSLSSSELRILLVIIAYDRLGGRTRVSYSRFQEATLISDPIISKSLKSLEAMKIIARQSAKGKEGCKGTTEFTVEYDVTKWDMTERRADTQAVFDARMQRRHKSYLKLKANQVAWTDKQARDENMQEEQDDTMPTPELDLPAGPFKLGKRRSV